MRVGLPLYSTTGDFDHVPGDVRQVGILSHRPPYDWHLLFVEVKSVSFLLVHPPNPFSVLCDYDTHVHLRIGGPPCLVNYGRGVERHLTGEEVEFVKYPKAWDDHAFRQRKAVSATCSVLVHSLELTRNCYPDAVWSEDGKKMTSITVPFDSLFHFEGKPLPTMGVPSMVGRHYDRVRGFYGTIVDQGDPYCWSSVVRVERLDDESISCMFPVALECPHYKDVPMTSGPDSEVVCYIRVNNNGASPRASPTHVSPVATTPVSRSPSPPKSPPPPVVVVVDEFQATFLKVCEADMPFAFSLARGKVIRLGEYDDGAQWVDVVAAGQKHRASDKVETTSKICKVERDGDPGYGDVVYVEPGNSYGPCLSGEARIIFCKDYEPGFDEFCRFLWNKGYGNSPTWRRGRSRLHDLMLYFWNPLDTTNKAGVEFRETFMNENRAKS